MGFLKFLFFVILIYYTLKLIARYVMPYLLSLFIKKAQDRMMGNANDNQGSRKQKKEGEVSVDATKQSPPKASKDKLGDYVDFEEVED